VGIEVDAKSSHPLVDLLEDVGVPRRHFLGTPQRVEASLLAFLQDVDPTQSPAIDRNIEMTVRRFTGLREANAFDADLQPIVVIARATTQRGFRWCPNLNFSASSARFLNIVQIGTLRGFRSVFVVDGCGLRIVEQFRLPPVNQSAHRSPSVVAVVAGSIRYCASDR
jgi:hypothetical protein